MAIGIFLGHCCNVSYFKEVNLNASEFRQRTGVTIIHAEKVRVHQPGLPLSQDSQRQAKYADKVNERLFELHTRFGGRHRDHCVAVTSKHEWTNSLIFISEL